MSDANVGERRLVAERASTGDRFASGIVALGLAVFAASWAVVFQWVDATADVAGVSLFAALGAALVAMGAGVAALGLGARHGAVAATPDRTAGLLVGLLFGTVGAATGGLVAAHALGLGTAGGAVGALAVGVAAAAASVLPREELGSTLPAAALLAFVGGVLATGAIDAAWSWSPAALSVTFVGHVVAPLLAMSGALVGVWSAAKAQAGFGARGRQRGAFLLVALSVFGMLAVLALLVGFIVVNGLDTVLTGAGFGVGERTVFGVGLPWPEVSAPFLTNVTQSLFVDVNGVMPAIVGTVWLVVGAVAFAVPLGVGAAVFLSEYARGERFTRLVEVATNGLWSTPSIVFGLFGLTFLLPRVSSGEKSLLGGQLVLGFMLLPLVVITSQESIKAVPDEYRDASAALGVSKWQTVRSVVLPAAMPGVVTGVILGVGRIAGETAPLLFVFGGSPFPGSGPNVLGSFELSASPPFVTNGALLESGSALPYQLYTSITSGQVPGEAFSASEFGWGTAFVLLLVVLLLYAVGIGTRLYFQRKLHHE